MSFVFSRLLPVAVLIAAKISIEGFVQTNLENACFSLPPTSYDENSSSQESDAVSTLCKWFSMITIDEGRSPHGNQNAAASIAAFPFGMLSFAIDSTTKLFSLNSKTTNNNSNNNNNPFVLGDFFKYEEVSKYLDFYITAMLVLTTIFAATSSSSAGILSYASKLLLPSGKKAKESEEEESDNASDDAPSFIINVLPLTFWCLLGSHTINRKTSSYLVENNNNNNVGNEDVLQQQYFPYSSSLMLGAVSLIVQNHTTFSTNSVVSRICGFAIWTFFLASGAMVENSLLWFSISFFLFLNIFSPLSPNKNNNNNNNVTGNNSNRSRLFAIRRFIACTFTLFVAGFCFAVIHFEFLDGSSSSSSATPSQHGAFSPLVFLASRLRNYGAGLDVGNREANWFPGSIVGELLVYGFRGPAPAIVVAQTLVPWILTIIIAMRLKMKFETAFWICALCDHREATILGHFAVGALLSINQLKATRSKSKQLQQSHQQRPSVYGPLMLSLATFELFSYCMMTCYFAAWSLYRSAQQNMSFYALVLGHLLLTLRLILDHEVEEAEAA